MVHKNSGRVAHPHGAVQDWEEWEDDEVVTPVDSGERLLIQPPHPPAARRTRASARPSALRASRHSSAKVKRLKSRHRQKAQNAKAGIRLITDMTACKRSTHVAHQVRNANGQPAKFVDAAALKALEGEPSSASVGNWNWLKRDKTQSPEPATPQRSSARTVDQELSPEDRPIVIGISVPSDEMGAREISPQTATVETYQAPLHGQNKGSASPLGGRNPSSLDVDTRVHRSVWSPDTPDTIHSFKSNRVASSVYSQAAMLGVFNTKKAPPVPALPETYKQKLISLELGGNTQDEEDSGTPCTLFEEDGVSTPQKLALGKGLGISPDSATSRSQGWWDHVVTPFVDKTFSFSSRKVKLDSPKEEPKSPWSGYDVKEKPAEERSLRVPKALVQAPVVRAPTPRRTPSPRTDAHTREESEASSSRAVPPSNAGTAVEKHRHIFVTEDVPRDQPPPYSPPKKELVAAPVRYRAVFPPGHALQAQFPPSPGPASPGLAATMTSQGATQMTSLPSAPSIRSQTPPAMGGPLPTRPLGTYLPQDHAQAASGRAHKVERRRRRHEKEEVAARRLGGFWRGRCCVPAAGCFGRTGREGRKRRRVWMAIWAGIMALMILIIVLAVVLTRHGGSDEVHSIWVNLTDFPPMPTGVLTVVGPDNAASKSVCTEPSTLWSCSLAKEQHGSVAPYQANQPTVIMQIQWDNSTRNAWNVSEPASGPVEVEVEVPRKGRSGASFASGLLRERQPLDGFTPDPSAPDFTETWFLGNTTDDIKSNRKAGEPTPFYISLVKSVNDTVSFPTLSRRGPSAQFPTLGRRGPSTQIGNESLSNLLPAPALEADGTPAPAVMLPNPVQQPVRLFDRGLPTEHYGFYTHFKRSMFVKSVTILNKTNDGNIPLDEDGGCRKDEADYLVTWGEARVLVKIWTRSLELNASALLRPDSGRGIGGTGELIRPGTMPYPVTVTLDTHGGNPKKKLVWDWPMDKRQKLNLDKPELLANDMGIGGTWINPRGTGDPKVGAFDGGTGGCKCEWVNWAHSPPPRAPTRSLLTLAIETSCDDTAVAVLSRSRTTGRTALLFNERVCSDNRAFQGVNPAVAVQGHNAALAPLVRRALAALPDAPPPGGSAVPGQAAARKQVPDFVAVTRGPGITANLAVGLNTAKGLAVAWDVPLVGVHHMQAHALTPRLARALGMGTGTRGEAGAPQTGPEFPFLSLLVSGGHTQLVHSAALADHRIVADTGDIAVGNLLDQTARVILPPEVLAASPDVMYGRQLEAFAFPPRPGRRAGDGDGDGDGDDGVAAQHAAFFTPARSRRDEMADVPSGHGWAVPLPFRNSRRLAYSFSSIHSHVHGLAAAAPAMPLAERRALARHTLRAAFQHLASRLCLALADEPALRPAARTLVVAGGVASNRFLAHVLRSTLAARGFPSVDIVAPPVALCTDNAAMIAWAAMEMYDAGWRTELSALPISRWPMDPAVGEGILGAEGWVRRHEDRHERT
ncbi:tRNA N6-adenosine threonylcarbamoyltransferase, mitochondrial [Tolypocladium ophioglossoides CBS 100239]|uniref:N(6)-L-threonylcarbamoyladenine synthase n=1 Tax=Tolypocladium ophioglossoides (strain CBS 100239) TaxID=1163406 RepID=A0A0L0NMU3_TOLOC|nr:tRNA N6-adenosine threonylcarbamoyltransferase, mitochondrial [Tolypocladium ophioglossoides CBS 100239]